MATNTLAPDKEKLLDWYHQIVLIRQFETVSDELYKEKKGYYSYAVSIGHLEFESIWNKEKTTIIHKLYGMNNIIEHSILYRDKSLTKEMPENTEIEEIKGL